MLRGDLLEDGKGQIVLGDEEAAFGGAFGRDAAENVFQIVGGDFALEGGLEGVGDSGEVAGGFVDELEAEVLDAGAKPLVEMGAGFLGFGAKDGVAAADIGHDGVGAALTVPESDSVFLARAAAILVSGSFRQEAAEDTVFGMEDGEVLVGDGLDFFRADVTGEGGDLCGVEVVSGGEAGEAHFEIGFGGKGVGGVEAEITDEGAAGAFKLMEDAGGADEDGAIETDEELGDTGLAGLEDSGAGDTDVAAFGFGAFDGGAEAVEVEVVECDGCDVEFEGGVELVRSPDQEVEGGRSGGVNVMAGLAGEGGNGAREGLGLEGLEGVDGFAAELIEERLRGEEVAFDLGGQFVQFVGGVAEAGKLVAEGGGVEGAVGGGRERLGGLDGDLFGRVAVEAPVEGKGLAGRGGGVDVDELAGDGGGGIEEGPCDAGEVGIVGTPEEVTGADPGEVDGVVGELEEERAVEFGEDFEEAAAFFRFGGAAPVGGIEDEAITGFKGGDEVGWGGLDGDGGGEDLDDRADVDATVARGAAADDGLVIDAGEEVGAETAGVDLFELEMLEGELLEGAAGPGIIDGEAIGAGGKGDIRGVLVAAFDFEAGDAGVDDLGDVVEGGEVAGGEEVAGLVEGFDAAIDEHFVFQAAGLGALAAIRGAAAPGFRGEALA